MAPRAGLLGGVLLVEERAPICSRDAASKYSRPPLGLFGHTAFRCPVRPRPKHIVG